MKTLAAGLHRRLAALLLAALLCLPAAPSLGEEIYYQADFEYLSMIAPNAVAWLYRPDGAFNVPVMYSADSDHYLRYRFNDHWDGTGSIFFTGDAPPDYTEPILTLHGNNCSDDLLFGSFYKYRREEGYYQQNPTFYLITPGGNYRLDVFAGIRTTHRDHETWAVTDSVTLLTETLPRILENSFLTPLPECLPQEGDQWLIMTTDDRQDEGTRYVLYTRMRRVDYPEDAEPVLVNQLELDSRETLNGYYTVDGVGTFMVYGQNDPSWDPLIFETDHSSRRRHFGDGGCGPTAVAAALANLITPQELLKINQYSPDPYGYTICSCSLTPMYCYQYHVKYRIDTSEEMLRYFPLVIGNFITGNNTLDLQGRYDSYGTNMYYLPELCWQVYGVTVNQTNSKQDAFAFLQARQGTAVTCTGDYNSPFTSSSHFIALVGADDEYVYIVDPLRREDYGDLDPNGMLEILTPGLVRMTKANAMLIMMSPIYLLSVE